MEGNEVLVVESKGAGYILRMVPKDVDISNLRFTKLNKEQVDEIGNKVDIVSSEVRVKNFIYNRERFIKDLKKSKMLKRFVKKYDCVVKESYDKKAVIELFDVWKDGIEKRGSMPPMKEEFLYLIDEGNIEKYNISVFYFEIDNKLVGIKIVYPYTKNSNMLVMGYQCSFYEYEGIGRFMDLEVASRFGNYELLTDGGDFVKKESRLEYKMNSRKPDIVEDLYYIET